MEKKQGFFSTLKEEVVRGLSPGRSRNRTPKPGRSRSGSPNSGLLRRRKGHHVAQTEPIMSRSGSLRPLEALSPLREGPDPNETTVDAAGDSSKVERWGHWMKGQLCRAPSAATSSGSGSASYQRSDLRLLLGVLGAPLAPVHVSNAEPFPHLSIKDTPIVSSHLSFLTHFDFLDKCFCNTTWVLIFLLQFITSIQLGY